MIERCMAAIALFALAVSVSAFAAAGGHGPPWALFLDGIAASCIGALILIGWFR